MTLRMINGRWLIFLENLSWALVIVNIEVWGYSLQKNQDQVFVFWYLLASD